jgi:hypothetical protein
MHEKGWCAEVRKMSGSGLFRLMGWVKWVGKQQKSVDQPWILGRQHRSLAAAIRVSAQKYTSGNFRPHCLNRTPQSFSVALGTAT